MLCRDGKSLRRHLAATLCARGCFLEVCPRLVTNGACYTLQVQNEGRHVMPPAFVRHSLHLATIIYNPCARLISSNLGSLLLHRMMRACKA